MIRVLKGHSATLQHTFYSNGVPTDPAPDTATLGIVRDDGTVLVTSGTPATELGTGTVIYTLTPTQIATLDRLMVTWTATFGGQSQGFTEIVEVVGGFLFTIAQARAVTPLNNAVTYPTQTIVDTRTLVEQALEDACGVAFVPRYRKESFDGTGIASLLAHQPRVTAIRSASLNGTALTASDLALIAGSTAGRLYYVNTWTSGYGNYVVAYEHGYEQPPLRMTQAALLLAKNWLVKGPIDDRTTAFSTEDGTFSLATPGLRGSTFGIPEVDAAVADYGLRVSVA